MTLYRAIQELEKAAMIDQSSKDYIHEQGRAECRSYLQWLRYQAPNTATCIPFWNQLTHKPTNP